MQDHDFIAVEVADELIRLNFGLRKYNRSVLRVVALDQSQHCLVSLTFLHHQRVVLNSH